jgi:hypothetical protein
MSPSSPRLPTHPLAGAALLSATLLLAACASGPQPPDWQASAFAALGNYTSAYLEGNTRVADYEFARAKSQVARTGRLDLMAKLELLRCATQVASLELGPCEAYAPLAADAAAPEQAYAAFLDGQWSDINPVLLPAHYRALVTQAREAAAPPTTSQASPSPAQLNHQLNQIQDPLARLIAAGALLKKELIAPVDIGQAVDTASSQGWRRPLLAWLGVQLKRAQAAGDNAAAAQLQRRIDLALQTLAK